MQVTAKRDGTRGDDGDHGYARRVGSVRQQSQSSEDTVPGWYLNMLMNVSNMCISVTRVEYGNSARNMIVHRTHHTRLTVMLKKKR